MADDPTTTLPTRERLLDAAGEVFAAHGYRGATVRRICERAGTNVSAINYHFGDKEQLYRQVLRYAFETARRGHPVPAPREDQAVADEVRGFVSAFLARLFSTGSGWSGRVMARELADPTGALHDVAEAYMRPLLAQLDRTVARARPDLPSERRQLHALTLIGQCVFFRHARPVLDVLLGPEAYSGPAAIPALSEHIAAVFLRGLELPAPGSER